MKLEEVQQAIQKTGLQPEQAQALLSLIDAKIENDMKEVLTEIRNVNTTLSTEMKRLEDKVDTKFNMVIWVMGILMALMLALKFFAN